MYNINLLEFIPHHITSLHVFYYQASYNFERRKTSTSISL